MQRTLLCNGTSTQQPNMTARYMKHLACSGTCLQITALLLYHLYTTYTHTHTHLTALFPGLPRWAGTRKAKPIWVLLKQETVSGSGISWNICKSAPRSRQITTPAPHHSIFFTGRMPFLPPNQQRQSTEGNIVIHNIVIHNIVTQN